MKKNEPSIICLLSTLLQSQQRGKLELDLGQKGSASVTTGTGSTTWQIQAGILEEYLRERQ